MDIQLQNQLKRLVEVTALEALSKIYISKDLLPKIAECEKELRKFAFPNELATRINKESDFVSVKGVCAVVNCLNTHNEVELVADINGKVPICINCLERK